DGGSLGGVLCGCSLAKQSNLAGYRAAFVAGDPELVGELIAVRKQVGMMMPGPVQAAMTVALGDEEGPAAQREIYRARRELLAPALQAAGGQIHGSQAGLYLWTTFGEEAMTSVARLAQHGGLVAPGMFYGGGGGTFVRVAPAAADERIASAARRLARLRPTPRRPCAAIRPRTTESPWITPRPPSSLWGRSPSTCPSSPLS